MSKHTPGPWYASRLNPEYPEVATIALTEDGFGYRGDEDPAGGRWIVKTMAHVGHLLPRPAPDCRTCNDEGVVYVVRCTGGRDHGGHHCGGTICGADEAPCPDCGGRE